MQNQPIKNTNNNPKYTIRAHHGMCLAFYVGKGYSEGFVDNMTYIKNEMSKNPLIQIVDYSDTVCDKCNNNIAGICVSLEKVKHYDAQVLKLCKISSGSIMTYNEFHELVMNNILTKNLRESICGDCCWNELCHFS